MSQVPGGESHESGVMKQDRVFLQAGFGQQGPGSLEGFPDCVPWGHTLVDASDSPIWPDSPQPLDCSDLHQGASWRVK